MRERDRERRNVREGGRGRQKDSLTEIKTERERSTKTREGRRERVEREVVQ